MESNYSFDLVMMRYGISNQITRKPDIHFVHQLRKLFENENTFNAALFNSFPLSVIIDYVENTHKYYLNKKLKEIEQSIDILLQDYSDNHPLLCILHEFYSDYTMELSEHILEEENTLLPYISYLISCEENDFSTPEFYMQSRNFSLCSFIESHHDTEDDLQKVRFAILSYNPPATNETPYRVLLSQLQVFEKDLSIHALIEDQVLIPRALKLERKWTDTFRGIWKMN
ncbi:MAG: hypothetical protein ABI772_05250 [Bacteroidota bacterium]